MHPYQQDFSSWATSVFSEVAERIPTSSDAPTLKGCMVILSHYVGANLYDDMLTLRSVTGILAALHKCNAHGLVC